MNYLEALDYLKEVQNKRLKLSISGIQEIIHNLPFDLENIKFIQVAGTNGKGSTSHFITSILLTCRIFGKELQSIKNGFQEPIFQNVCQR